MHSKNRFKNDYDFDLLIQKNPQLKRYVHQNKYGNLSIDFSNPKAVKELNTGLLFCYDGIQSWNFPDQNLCPPIPGRLDYILYLHDLLATEEKCTILDIGTGATCIYPLLGVAEHQWNFVATDIDSKSLEIAQSIIQNNGLSNKIELREQRNKQQILKGILKEGEHFSATICNPPFYKSAEEARGANRRKSRNLGNVSLRNFSGNENELWYVGGEKAFLHNYLYESSLFSSKSTWFTSLVSKKENVLSLEKSSQKLHVTEFKVIELQQGNKVSRIVCWRF